MQTIRPIPAIQRELPKAMMTVPVDVLSGMVHIVQPFMIGDAADMFARSVAATDQEKTKPDEKTSPRPGNDRAEAAPSEPPSPSTNGGNGQPKAEGGPSANGSNGHPKPLPPWLAEIAAKMPPLPDHFGKGQRRRGKR